MDAPGPRILAATLALTFATTACGPRTESKTRQTVAYVAGSEVCPDAGEIERRQRMTYHEQITSVEMQVRVPVAARSRVCWYRVTYIDPTSASTLAEVLADHEQRREAMCPDRSRWLDLDATRADYLADHAPENRMTCMERPSADPGSLVRCLEEPDIDSFECVEDAFIVAARQPFDIPCKEAGEVVEYRARIDERAAEDELPDMAACFYRIEYDEEVSGKLGSIGGGLR